MEPIKQLAGHFHATAQVAREDVAGIAAAGYKSMICNRPDGEAGPDQPSHEEIAQALQVPLGTVKSHVNRGVKKLRALMRSDTHG